jgi:hypothetical protein
VDATGRPSFAADQDEGHQRGSGRPIPPLVSEIQAATTNAGARAQGGLTPDFLTLSQIMPRNQKLTKVIAGRTIKAATIEPGGLLVVLFDDQSSMKIKTTTVPALSPGRKVKCVHEAKAEFKIEFEDGSSATLCLADPGSAIAVRDKNNVVEYLG